ncbi:hypothetical protein ACE939_01810 [Aquimarina sp. W85]|uniref:hypothetical protein n=1 Tax=Aquimarina rhodophyticola TaxID=3342246 RepID=UPI00366C2F9C
MFFYTFSYHTKSMLHMVITCLAFIIVAPIATLMMTAFSYLASYIRKRQFKEPELLTILMHRHFKINSDKRTTNLPGWVLHFLLGYLFLFIYDSCFVYTSIEPSLGWSFIVGIGMGILGIIGWQIIFAINPNPPKVTFHEFYIQLVIAHVIFALIGYLGYYIRMFIS